MTRETSAGIILTILVVGLLTSLFSVQPARASGTIYIRADGSVDPPTAPIQRDGDVYTFTGDIFDEIVVETNNIVVDGAGYAVQGSGGYDSTGINLTGRRNVVVRNAIFRDFYYGIYLSLSRDNIISGNTVSNSSYGIYLLNFNSNNTLADNTVTNSDMGVRLYLSMDNILSGNNASNNRRGISLEYYSSGNELSENTALNNEGAGIHLSISHSNSLYENNAANNNYGIYISGSKHTILDSNTASDNNQGIYLYTSGNSTFTSNVASNNKYNFGVFGSSSSHFDNLVDTSNTVEGKPIYYLRGVTDASYDAQTNAGTVYLIDCNNVTVRDLNLTKNRYGVYLYNTTNSIIENVTASDNLANGIELRSSSNNTLIDNTASYNGLGGIRIYFSNNNTLFSNIASNCNNRGITLSYSSQNLLGGNTALNNRWNFGVVGYSPSHFENYVDTSNTVDSKPIYYLMDIADATYDAETNAGTVYLINCNNVTIKDLNLTNNRYGVLLYNTTYSIIENVSAWSNSRGISLQSSSNNSLIGNTVSNSSGQGVDLEFGGSNSLTGNIISNNYRGIYIEYSSNNTIFHNSFINNQHQAYARESVNTWDNGYASGGNYWSDYTGNDTDGDGIGDTPYSFYLDNQDNYPLMESWSPPAMTKALVRTVKSWGFHRGLEKSLVAKLDGTVRLLDSGNDNRAVRNLMAFIRQVKALRERRITNQQADFLISEAQGIIDFING